MSLVQMHFYIPMQLCHWEIHLPPDIEMRVDLLAILINWNELSKEWKRKETKRNRNFTFNLKAAAVPSKHFATPTLQK